jgi:hypothetical protein
MSRAIRVQIGLSRREIGLTVVVFADRRSDQLALSTLTSELRRASLKAVEPPANAVRIRAMGAAR